MNFLIFIDLVSPQKKLLADISLVSLNQVQTTGTMTFYVWSVFLKTGNVLSNLNQEHEPFEDMHTQLFFQQIQIVQTVMNKKLYICTIFWTYIKSASWM